MQAFNNDRTDANEVFGARSSELSWTLIALTINQKDLGLRKSLSREVVIHKW